MKKSILIISFSVISRDPRVMRQIQLLESRFDVTVAGYGEKPVADINFIQLVKPQRGSLATKILRTLKLLLGSFESYYWSLGHVISAVEMLKGLTPNLVIANDLSALPLAIRLFNGKPIIYDAHEYAPREYDNQLLWRLLFGRYNHAFCRRYLPQVTSMMTVCGGIADEYASQYGVRPLVVHNAPTYQDLVPSLAQPDVITMVHHGVASPVRHLELMIETMTYLDQRFTLDFMLIEIDSNYMKSLRDMAQHDKRIRFIDPVPMQQICQHINEYDVGLYVLPPENFNHSHALPNKFFEFVQARLAIAIGPSPEMASLVRKHGCGIVSESFEPKNLADALNKLSAIDVQSLKGASHKAAKELCFEKNGQVILSEVQRLI